jgi:hypothetical protein
LLAESDDPPMVVMTHLDGTGSLADALLGADARSARRALTLWAEALAALHAAGTAEMRTAFSGSPRTRKPWTTCAGCRRGWPISATRS